MSQLLNIFTTIINFTGNFWVDSFIFVIIEIISGCVAFGTIGEICDIFCFHNSFIMSLCNKIVKVLIFLILTCAGIGIVYFIKFIISLPSWAKITTGILLGITIILATIKHFVNRSLKTY